MDNYQFSIPLGGEEVARRLHFAAEHRFGVEIVAFATGACLHDEAARSKMERGLHAALTGFPQARSFHAAFIDLSVHSADPAVAALTRDRIKRDLETASRLGCATTVFHTGFNPLVPVQRYKDEFVERHAAFWPEAADAAPDMTICLENMWESSPQLLDRLLREIGHPRVGMCLDVAHAHVYGDFGVERWMDCLKNRIMHMHWNDNQGDSDAHLPIGEGNVPWKEILAATQTLSRRLNVVLELKSLRAVQESLRYLNALKPSPPQSPARKSALA